MVCATSSPSANEEKQVKSSVTNQAGGVPKGFCSLRTLCSRQSGRVPCMSCLGRTRWGEWMKCGDLAVACAQTSEKQDRKRSVVNQSRANPSPVSFSLITGKKKQRNPNVRTGSIRARSGWEFAASGRLWSISRSACCVATCAQWR